MLLFAENKTLERNRQYTINISIDEIAWGFLRNNLAVFISTGYAIDDEDNEYEL